MISNAKQVNNLISGIKKKMLRINNKIKLDYTNGALDMEIDTGSEQIDLSDNLVKLLILNNGVAELLHKNSNNISNIDVALLNESIYSNIENIHNLYNNDASPLYYFDFFPVNSTITVLYSLGLTIDDIIEAASIEMLLYGCMQLKSSTELTKTHSFNSLIWFYILVKNGYMDELIKDKIVSFDSSLTEKITKGCDFNTFCDWINSMGLNGNLLKTYINTYYSNEQNNDKVKNFLIELNTEMEKANNNSDTPKDKVLEVKNKEAEREDVKILTNSGINLLDLITYYRLNEDEKTFSKLIGLIHSAFNLHTSDTNECIRNACSDFNTAIDMAIKSLSSKIEEDEEDFIKTAEDTLKHKEELDKYKELSKTYKSKLKQAEKEIDELKKRLITQKSKNDKQVAYIESLKSQGITNIKPYKDEIGQLREQLKARDEELVSSKRTQNRLNQTYQELKTAYSIKSEQCDSLTGQIEELNSKLSSALIANQGNNIPLECYIKAIRNKKIALFGGNMMHSELKNLGFRNLKLFEASNRNMSFSDLAHQDLIVVVTGYMSHSTMQIPKGASDRYNVPIYYFNNKNIQMLIQELFAVFYSDKYKSFKESKKDMSI